LISPIIPEDREEGETQEEKVKEAKTESEHKMN
jgi:hypothetical protein